MYKLKLFFIACVFLTNNVFADDSLKIKFVGNQVEMNNGALSLIFQNDKNFKLLETTPQKFFVINNYDAEKQSNSSGALRQLVLKKDWALYTVEFDLSNTVSTVSSLKNAGSAHMITKSTATDRKDFDVAISSTSKNAGLLFTDVTFKKKN